MNTKEKLAVMKSISEKNDASQEQFAKKEPVIRCILIRVTDDPRADVVAVENGLDGFYGALGVDTIDIVRRRIGGQYFDIVCDDNGLLADNPTPSAVNLERRETMFVGNILICNYAGDGELGSLSDDDIKHIAKSIKGHIGDDYVVYPILTDVDY